MFCILLLDQTVLVQIAVVDEAEVFRQVTIVAVRSVQVVAAVFRLDLELAVGILVLVVVAVVRNSSDNSSSTNNNNSICIYACSIMSNSAKAAAVVSVEVSIVGSVQIVLRVLEC